MLARLKTHFTPAELKLIDGLDTPEKIQNFIDGENGYDTEREDRSVKEVVADRRGECYNGALLATFCLLCHGTHASVLEVLARDDEEHILCLYKQKGKFGSIAQSKFLGLKGRNPMYDTVRDLIVSYQEFFFAWDGRFSLDSYTNPIDLKKYDMKWVYDPKTVVQMGKDLRQAKHFKIAKGEVPVFYVSPERFWKETLYIPKGTKIPKKYLAKKP